MRAAYWTAGLLTAMDGADPEGPTLGSVFAISGVSGGSIGAAVAVALLSERARQGTGRTVST